jgi:phosphoribosylaminoimidazole-succinocarboxamide synthase
MTTLPRAIENTYFAWLGEKYTGKVRDVYSRGDTKVLIATDRLSAYDRLLTTVPLKGEVLTQLANFWFQKVAHIVSHHVLAIPDPNVMIATAVEIIPIEVVVRGYLAGGGWREYSATGQVSGVTLPQGMHEFQKLDSPIITPSTKEPAGNHDIPISEDEIVRRGIVSEAVWSKVRALALQLFHLGSEEVASRGLLLVDTKYEFGVKDAEVVLADEIHTLDSSRFWVASSFEAYKTGGAQPEMLDKEPVRRWLAERGFMGEGQIPEITDRERALWMEHYLKSFELITGKSLSPNSKGDPLERMDANLRKFFNIV